MSHLSSIDGIAPADRFGSKAHRLSILSKVVPVPEWLAVECSIYDHLTQQLDRRLRQQLDNLLVNKLNVFDRMAEIRDAITQETLSAGVAKGIEHLVKASGVAEPYAVRSSALFEDSDSATAAGLYESYINVEADELAVAVVRVVTSGLSPRALMICPDVRPGSKVLRVGVIIQAFVPGSRAGVMFTANPMTADNGHWVVEYDWSQTGATGGGARKVAQMGFDLARRTWEGVAASDRALVESLTEIGDRVGSTFEGPQDIEWVEDHQGLVWVVQTRPVERPGRRSPDRTFVVELKDVSLELAPAVPGLAKRIDKWSKKKIPLFRFCAANNIDYCHCALVFIATRSQIQTAVNQILQICRSDYLSAMLNENVVDLKCHRDGLADLLNTVMDEMVSNSVCACICENWPNDSSMISSLTASGELYIEYVAGSFKALNSGESTPSWIAMHRDGSIDAGPGEQRVAYFFDHKALDHRLRIESPPVAAPVGELELDVANRATRMAYEEFDGKVALEWWRIGSRLLVRDASLAKGTCLAEYGRKAGQQVISPGTASGEIIRIWPEDWGLEEDDNYLSYGRAISVIESDVAVKELAPVIRLRQYIKEHRASVGPLIAATPRPLLVLSTVMDLIDGFVFEYAGLLSHLSILLREHGIPAVSLGNERFQTVSGHYRLEV